MTGIAWVGLGTKYALPLVTKSIASFFQRDYTSRAIDLTLTDLDSRYEGLADHLERYRDSDDYASRLAKFQAGERPAVDDSAVAAFLEWTDFHNGRRTKASAAEILEALFENLSRVLYTDKEGVRFQANRNEVLTENAREQVLSAVGDLAADLARRVPLDEANETRSASEKVLDARVDEARDLLNGHRVKDAQRILSDIWPRLDAANASPNLRFRVATNLGACALHRDDLQEARKWFLEAWKFRPDSPKAPTNLALMDLIEGNFGGAISLTGQALAVDPRNPDAMAVQLMALGNSGQTERLAATLADADWIASDASCTHALGELAYKAQHFDEAARWLRISLGLSDNTPETHELLATTLIGRVKQQAQDDLPFMAHLAPEIQTQLEEAERHLTVAIDIFAHREPKRSFHGALINRAAARAMLLNSQGAIDDAQRVLLDDPEPSVADAAHSNAGRAFLLAGRPQDAINMFEAIRSPADRAEVTIALALVYRQAKEYRKALDLLQPAWAAGGDSERRLTVAELLVQVLWDTNQTDQIPPILAVVEEQFGDNARAACIRADHEERSGNRDSAIALLRAPLPTATGSARDYLVLQLALVLGRGESYSEAADHFQTIVGETPSGPLAQRLLQALFQAGRFREAWDLLEQLKQNGEADGSVMRIRAYLLGYVGDLQAAFDAYMDLSRTEPLNVEYLVEAAQVAYRLGRLDEARRIVTSIPDAGAWNDPDILMSLATLYLLLNLDGSLRLAYRARRLAYDRPDIHGRYATLVMNLEQQERLTAPPETVSIRSAVTLDRGAESRTFVILDDDNLSLARGELAPTDVVARKLLGLRVGDPVILGGPATPPFTVKAIRSCYVQAARETLADAPVIFDEASPFQPIPITPGEEGNPLWRHLDGFRRHMVAVVRAYESGQLTLGAAARLGGRSVFGIWQDLVNDPSLSVRVDSGNQASRDQAIQNAVSASVLVLDATAIFTIVHLGLQDLVRTKLPELLAQSATLDEITENLATDHFGNGTLVAGEGGRLIAIPMDEEWRNARRQLLEDARDFVLTACTLVPATRALDLGRDEFDDLADTLSRGAVASALVAAERHALFWADDAGLRQIALSDWSVEGAGTPHILAALRERGDLPDEEYFAAIRALHVAGYVFVTVGWQDLVAALKASQWQITREVEATFGSLAGPTCSEASAVSVAAAFLRHLWLDSHFGPRRSLGVNLILGSLVKGRSPDRVLELLRRAVLVRFALLTDNYREEVLGEIAVWHQFRPPQTL